LGLVWLVAVINHLQGMGVWRNSMEIQYSGQASRSGPMVKDRRVMDGTPKKLRSRQLKSVRWGTRFDSWIGYVKQ